MNGLANEMARRNGLITFKQACAFYDTTKDKLRDLINSGLLTYQKSTLDRRAKLLKLEDLDRLLGLREESTAPLRHPNADKKVA